MWVESWVSTSSQGGRGSCRCLVQLSLGFRCSAFCRDRGGEGFRGGGVCIRVWIRSNRVVSCRVVINTQTTDGTPVEDSRSRGRPFQFKVGVGQVVKGMDIAIKQMSRGQRAKVVIPAELGYGAEGAYPLIPPYASLLFEVSTRQCDAAVTLESLLLLLGSLSNRDVHPLHRVARVPQLQLIDFYDATVDLTPRDKYDPELDGTPRDVA